MDYILLLGCFRGRSECKTGNADTVLFSATALPPMLSLGQVFEQLASSQVAEVRIHELPFVKCYGGVEVTARVTAIDSGMQRVGEGPIFSWHTTPAYWRHFAHLTTGIGVHIRHPLGDAESSMAGGHQYLDTDEKDSVDVEISLAEYSVEFFERMHAGTNRA